MKSVVKIFTSILFVGCCLYLITKQDSGKLSSIQRSENVLRLNFRQDPISLDPRKGSDPLSPALHVMILQGLTRMSPSGLHEPALAENITISKDYKTYIFKLKEAYWSDQTRITSHDFAKTWKEVLDPKFPSPVAYLFFIIKNGERAFRGETSLEEVAIYTPDDSTLIVELEHPAPYFLDLTSFSAFFAVKYPGARHKGDFPLCSGPFLLKKWHHGDQIVLEKNPAFWDAEHVRLQGIYINIVESDLTSLSMFENQEIDFVGASFSPIPIDTLGILAKQDLVHSAPLGATTALFFNVEKFPYNNKHIRQSIAYAIDRKEIVENMLQLQGCVAKELIPPALQEGVSSQKEPSFNDHNARLAKELYKLGLQELGISREDFPPAIISYYNEDSYAKTAQAIQQQLQETLGIQVKLASCELRYFLQKVRQKDFQIGAFSWSAQYINPMSIFERFKNKNNVKNYCSWENASYTQLLNASVNTPFPEERSLLLSQAESILAEEVPFTCLYHWNSYYLIQPYVKGFFISPIGTVHWEFATID